MVCFLQPVRSGPAAVYPKASDSAAAAVALAASRYDRKVSALLSVAFLGICFSRSTLRRPSICRGMMLVLVVAISAGPVVADSPNIGAERADAHIRSAEEYVRLFIEREGLSIRNALISQETEILNAAGQADASSRQLTVSLAKLSQADREMLGHLARIVHGNLGPLSDQFERAQLDTARRIVETESAWCRLRTEVFQQRCVEADLRDQRRTATHAATLLSLNDRWFWLVAVIPLLVLLGVVYLDSEHPVHGMFHRGPLPRPWRTVLAGLVAAIMIAVVATAFLLAEPIYAKLLQIGSGWKTEPRHGISRENESLEADIRHLEQASHRLQVHHKDAQTEWESVLGQSFPGDPELVQLERQLREVRRTVAENTALLTSLSEAMQADLREVAQLRDQCDAKRRAIARGVRTRLLVQVVMGALVLVAVGYVGVARRSPVPLGQRVAAGVAAWLQAGKRRRSPLHSSQSPGESDSDEERAGDLDPDSPDVQMDVSSSPADADQDPGGTLESLK